MATAKVKTATNGICTELVAKAKAYRLANITARMTSAGTGSLSDYKLNAKKEKLESDKEFQKNWKAYYAYIYSKRG